MTRLDTTEQAEAFLSWHRKRGQALEDDFGAWCRGKDFRGADRARIWWAVQEIQASYGDAAPPLWPLEMVR